MNFFAVIATLKGQRPDFIIAQPAGLGMRGETLCGLKARVIAIGAGIMTRAFSPHGVLISQPSPMGWAIMKRAVGPARRLFTSKQNNCK